MERKLLEVERVERLSELSEQLSTTLLPLQSRP